MAELVILGFGSNLGNRFRNIQSSLRMIALNKNMNLLKVSAVYETEPWGVSGQNSFYNCAAVFLCRMNPLGLLKTVKNTERSNGRKKRGKWQPREIDIDILFYGNIVFSGGELKIPHPFLHRRNFVLKPLVDIIPEYIHPAYKKSVLDLYKGSKDNCKVKEIRAFSG